MALADEVRTALHRYRELNPKLSRPEVAQMAGINRHWLEKFDQGVIQNPTLRNLERLREFLSSRAGQTSAAGAVPA